MILSTLETVPNKTIAEVLGIVRGSTVRSPDIGRDISSAFKAMAGGELKHYTELLSDSREEALKRMLEDAETLQADAVVGVRFTISSVMQGAAEIMAYGTAVKLT